MSWLRLIGGASLPQAPVIPRAHAEELAEVAGKVAGVKVGEVGRDFRDTVLGGEQVTGGRVQSDALDVLSDALAEAGSEQSGELAAGQTDTGRKVVMPQRLVEMGRPAPPTLTPR